MKLTIMTTFGALTIATSATAGGIVSDRLMPLVLPQTITAPPATCPPHTPWTMCGGEKEGGTTTIPTPRPTVPTPQPHPVDPVVPVEPPVTDPKHPAPPKGNASANNGTGGNYDKTGHVDNGKGRK